MNLQDKMKELDKKDKNIALHQLHLWVSSALNVAVGFLFLYLQTKKNVAILVSILGFFCIVHEGINNIHDFTDRNGRKKVGYLVFDAVVFLSISIATIVTLYEYLCILGMMVISIMILVELSVIPLITFRLKIKNKIIKHFEARKKRNEGKL